MKTFLSVFVLFLLCSSPLIAQPYWQSVYSESAPYTNEFCFRGAEVFAAGLNGLKHSSNSGLTWNSVFADSEAASVGITLASTIVVGFFDYQVFSIRRSTDEGASWTTVATSPNYSFSRFKTGHNGNIFCIEYYGFGVYRSTDDGATWSSVASGLAHRTIDVLPLDNSTLLVGCDSGYYSMNFNGSNLDYHMTPDEWHHLVKAPNGRLYSATTWGLYRSTYNGVNWTMVMDSSVLGPVGVDSENNVYVMRLRDNRFLRSTDNGETWNDYSQGMTLTSYDNILACGFNTATGHMYAGGQMNIYRTINPSGIFFGDPVSTTLPTKLSLLPAFPNPFNATTTIQFYLPRISNIRLTIFDPLGREVESLVENRTYTAGSHRVMWHGTGYASGTYTYILESDGIAKTGRMVLVK